MGANAVRQLAITPDLDASVAFAERVLGLRVSERVAELLGTERPPSREAARWQAVAAVLIALTLGVVGSAPQALAAGVDVIHTAPAHHSSDC